MRTVPMRSGMASPRTRLRHLSTGDPVESLDGSAPLDPGRGGTLVANASAMHQVPPNLAPSTALRSAAVGASATLLDLVVLATLVHLAAVAPRIASPIALLAGVAVQFIGNKLLTFRDRSGRWGVQAAAFLGVELGAFALNALSFDAIVATTALPALPVRIVVSAAVYFFFCLPLWSRVFVRSAPQAAVG